MNKLIKLLPAFALVLAATFAFAFSPKISTMDVFGQSGGQWYDVTGITPGPSTYTCDSQTNKECLFDDVDGAPIHPNENKAFVKRGALPLAD